MERPRYVSDRLPIAAVPEAVPLNTAQRDELDRRLEAYHCDPASGAPWDELRERIRSGR
ncbi:addiction module protein [bacterium]|nr:addiction module protein [bacterium]